MSKIEKLKKIQQLVYSYILKFRDVRFAGQVLFVVIVLSVSWSGIKAIDTNYSLQKQIAVLQQQNAVQQLENKNLSLQNQYYNSQQYQELSARQDLGLAAPGEKELLVPQTVAESYIVPLPQTPSPKQVAAPPLFIRNIKAWVNFFLHHQQSLN